MDSQGNLLEVQELFPDLVKLNHEHPMVEGEGEGEKKRKRKEREQMEV